MQRDTVAPAAPQAPPSLPARSDAATFREWQNADESRRFACAFSKALVEALVRGEGSVAVCIDGEIVWQTSRP